MIRPLQASDVPWAASQHAGLMPNSVFAVFGAAFLACFYRVLADSPHGVAFVFQQDAAPAAVIASTSNRPAFLRELLRRRGILLAWLGLRGFLADSRCRHLLAQAPRYLRRSAANRAAAEMLFITVSPDCRRRGVAHDLIRATLDELRRRGVPCVNVSIESANEPVRRVLISLGFSGVDEFVFADKPNQLLSRTL